MEIYKLLIPQCLKRRQSNVDSETSVLVVTMLKYRLTPKKPYFLVFFHSKGGRLRILKIRLSSESKSFISRASFWCAEFSSKICITSSSSFLFLLSYSFCNRSLDKISFSKLSSDFFDFLVEVFELLSLFSLSYPTDTQLFCSISCKVFSGGSSSFLWRVE